MNKALIVGTINHLIFIAIAKGCILTGIDCEGTDMGAYIFIYSFSFFPIQFVIELFVFISFFIELLKGKWKETGIAYLAIFVASFILFLYVGELI